MKRIFVVAGKDKWRELSAKLFQHLRKRIDFDLITGRVDILWNGDGEIKQGKRGGEFRQTSLLVEYPNGTQDRLFFATQNPEGISKQARLVKAGHNKSEEFIWMYVWRGFPLYIARFDYCGAERFSLNILERR